MKNIKPTLLVDDEDLDPVARGILEAGRRGNQVLGGPEEELRLISDALPRAVTERLLGIVPPGFRLSEISIQVALGGKVFGLGVEGEVTVVMSRDSEQPS